MMLLVLLLGCGKAATTCDAVCEHLVLECGYEAFPSFDSCLQGCVYEEELGADMGGELGCLEKAGCDTFGILECERKFGVQADD